MHNSCNRDRSVSPGIELKLAPAQNRTNSDAQRVQLRSCDVCVWVGRSIGFKRSRSISDAEVVQPRSIGFKRNRSISDAEVVQQRSIDL
eukprot:14045616-Alexandrium_andersonii.AAC.1